MSVVGEAVQAALGKTHRDDPVLGVTGGPAANARLTAWSGLVLLVLSLAELLTLVSVTRLISWHIAIGVALVAPVALKVATTGWRMLRYYTQHAAYRRAGPPPLLFRLLGPLVVVGTMLLLATGLWLVFLGPEHARSPLMTVVGQDITPLTLHQATFIVWGGATGLHVLGRLVLAVRLARSREQIPGRGLRTSAMLGTVVAAGVSVFWVLDRAVAWA